MTTWHDVPEHKMRAVQLATALFSLSRFYIEAPNPDVVARFSDPAMAGTWPLRDETSLCALEDIGRAKESSYVLGAEFAALLGPGGVLRMAESEYTGEDGLPLVQELARLYAGTGYASHKTENYPRDHIAVELGFLGHLVIRAGEDPGGLDEVTRFYEGHLKRFIGELLDGIEQATTTVTYRGVVDLTRAALDGVEELTAGHE